MNLRLRPLAASLALAFIAGCGSDEPAEPKPDQPTRPAVAAATPLADSYAGTWVRDDGVVFTVEDDGSAVTGVLKEDPRLQLTGVEFSLSRGEGALQGETHLAGDGVDTTVRWDLQADAGGNLKGRVQSVWLDGEELVTFSQDPEWIEVSFAVTPAPAPEPPPEAVAAAGDAGEDPAPMDDGEGPTPEAVPDEEVTPNGDEEAPTPTAVDDGEDEAPEDEAPEDEAPEDEAPEDEAPEDEAPEDEAPADEARPTPTVAETFGEQPEDTTDEELEAERLRQEAAAAAGSKPTFTPEQIAEKLSSPQGLAELLFEAIRWNDTALLGECWINEADAQTLAGKKAAKYLSIARQQRNRSWTKLRRDHPGARAGTLARIDAEVTDGKIQQVKDGAIVYTLEGEELTIPMSRLIRVPDGSWKALTLIPRKRKKKG